MTKSKKNGNIVPLTKAMIDKVFEQATEQAEYTVGLYKLVIPLWDNVDRLDGYPTVGDETTTYIFSKAIAFDKAHHPEVVSGGRWMNSGFSHVVGMQEWVADISKAGIVYKTAVEGIVIRVVPK